MDPKYKLNNEEENKLAKPVTRYVVALCRYASDVFLIAKL